MKQSRKAILSVIGLCVLSALGGVLLFELVDDHRFDLRLFQVPEKQGSEPALAFTAPRRGYTPFENSVLVEIYRDPRTKVRDEHVSEWFDQCYMRAKGPASTFPHPFSVALMGDSYTWGAEVRYEDTLQARLEARFDGINIANFGMSGRSSRYFASMARRALACTGLPGVHAAVVGIYTDMHVGDIPRQIANERFGDWVILDGVAVPRSVYDRVTRSSWRHALFSLDIWIRQWSAAYNRLFPFHRQPSNEEFAVDLTGELVPEHFPGWINRLIGNLSDFTQAVNLSPSKVIVWLVPSNLETTDLWLEQREATKRFAGLRRFWRQVKAKVREFTYLWFGSERPREFAAYVTASRDFWRQAATKLSEAGFVVVDPRQNVDDLFWLSGRYPYSGSGHLRPEAYAIVTDAIEPALRRALGTNASIVQSRYNAQK